jgi:transketolase
MATKIATRDSYGRTLAEIGSDKRVVVLDADLSKSTKTAMFQEKYPERFVNIGIAECNMISVAAGIASCGKIVFASSFAMFAVVRAGEQIRNSVCYPELNVKICASHAGITVGEDGASHQCIEDIALLRAVPNITILNPCDDLSARAAVRAAYETDGPFYIRLGRPGVEVVYSPDNFKFELGKGIQIYDGNDATIMATGLMVQEAIKARDILADEGINARVIDIHTIKPIDREIIIKAAKETGAIVTCEEHNVIGGLGSAVAEVVASEYPCSMGFIGIQDKFGKSGTPAELMKMYGLTPEDIASKVKEVINKKKSFN